MSRRRLLARSARSLTAASRDRRRRRAAGQSRARLRGRSRDQDRRRARADGQDGRRRSARTTRSRRASSTTLVAGLTQQPPRTVANPSAAVTMAAARRAPRPRARPHRRRAALHAGAQRAGLAPPAASAPRPSPGCSACARTIRPPRTTSSSRPATRRRAPRPRTPPRGSCSFGELGDGSTLEDAAATLRAPGAHRRGRQSVLDDGRAASSATRTSGAARASGRRRRSASQAPRRLRLLRLRLARLQAPGVPGRRRTLADDLAGPHDLRDERRGAGARSGSRSRKLAACRRPLLRREAARSRSRPRSTTPASTSANGWFIHSSGYGVALDAADRLVRRSLRVGPPAARRGRPRPRCLKTYFDANPPYGGLRRQRAREESARLASVVGGE